MSYSDKLLEVLKGAGVDTASLEDLGGLDNALQGFVGSFVEEAVEKTAAEQKAEAEKWRQQAEENERRFQNKDKALSEQDRRIKELEGKLSLSSADSASASNVALESLRDEFSGRLDEVTKLLRAQTERAEQLEAEVKWQQVVDGVAKEYPVLADPTFKELIPRTTDEAVLRERAQILTDYQRATQDHAYQQVRDGYIPPTAPPTVRPDDSEGFEREVARIGRLQDAGELTPQEAQKELGKLAGMMQPQ